MVTAASRASCFTVHGRLRCWTGWSASLTGTAACPLAVAVASRFVAGDESASFEQVASIIVRSAPVEVTGAYDGTHAPGEPGDFEFAGYVVEAEIDRDTGAVRIHDVLLAADVGTIINPVAHQGQLEGGLMFGIGAALMEELLVQDGQITTLTLGDYKLPCAMDTPPFRTVLLP